MTLGDVLRHSALAMRGAPVRTGLSLLGVTVGVASVIVLTSLGEGARLYVAGEFAQLGTNLLIVVPGKTETTGMVPFFGGAPHDLTLEDAAAIERRIPAARRVAPLAIGEGLVRHRQRARRITVLGTTAAFREVREIDMRVGRYLPEGEDAPRVCVLGATVARELFQGANPLGSLVRIGDRRFRVIGVTAPRGVSVGLNLDDMVHVPVRHALRLFNRRSLFRILITVRSHAEIDKARGAVVSLLKERHDGREDVTVFTRDAVLSTFGRILGMLTLAVGSIAGISLAVAGIGIMNVMLVAVSERTVEVGLFRAVGASRRQIAALFLGEAFLLSAGGGAAGLAVGILAGRLIHGAFPVLPVQAPAAAVAAAVAVSLITGPLFGSLPAVRASLLDPIVALRGGGR